MRLCSRGSLSARLCGISTRLLISRIGPATDIVGLSVAGLGLMGGLRIGLSIGHRLRLYRGGLLYNRRSLGRHGIGVCENIFERVIEGEVHLGGFCLL